MVNYKVVKYTADISNPNDLKADVPEVNTGLNIKTGIAVDKARELCRFLNFGGGFDGETPTFFLSEIKKNTDSNEYLV